MCGVAGIYAYHYAAPPVDREELRCIRDRMTARGPDGSGEWFSADGRVALGHRRLAIIDLSDRGAQPMRSADGNLIVSFNGEIYNHAVLRNDLKRKGYVFQSRTDTEVLLHLYADRGVDMLQDLRGMFAFALWDGRRQALLLARDPYGIKPLYYADDGWTVRFALQVKALLAGDRVSRTPEPAGLAGFYLFGSVPEPFTLYQQIRAVPAGSYVWVDDVGPREPRQWFSIASVLREAAEQPQRHPDGELQGLVRKALRDSVRHHLVADVPVGVFLSGGIDSGALLGLTRDVAPEQRPLAVTLAFKEFRGKVEDEAPLASEVAFYYEAPHRIRTVSEREFRDDLPKILEAMDQPSIDGINVWFVSKAAKEAGLKVALCGLGGDELFGGYPSFHDVPRWVGLMAVPSRIPFLGDLVRLVGTSLLTPHSSLSPKALGLLKYGGSYAGAYLLRRGLFMPWELPALIGRDMACEGVRRLHPLALIREAMMPDPRTPYGRVAALEANLYMRNQLLRDADWAGMAHSVEIRVPLVDALLLRALAPALVARPWMDGKRLLASSPDLPLPHKVIDRSKTGFGTPIERWIQPDRARVAAQRWHWARHWACDVLAPAAACT